MKTTPFNPRLGPIRPVRAQGIRYEAPQEQPKPAPVQALEIVGKAVLLVIAPNAARWVG